MECPLATATAPASLPPSLTRTTTANILLNKYELGKLLGRGSFAKVHAARSIDAAAGDDSKVVAVKIIDKTKIDASMEPMIVSEITAMRRLQHHPNILKIHEVMATKSKIFLVMELAAGGDLYSHVIQRGRFREAAARRYFQQLVSALNFCHQNGVTHRDVKPQNLLLDADGNLRISDFGLSALAESRGAVLKTACGTPAFTAPEVLTRRGYDGAKADAWSCGVILFFLLSASLPFDDSNLVRMYKRIHRREYKMPAWISKAAKSLINQLLDPNPETRMSIEGVMRHCWFVKNLEIEDRSCVVELGWKKECGFVNAFDIISLSSGLDLSGLLGRRRERRFVSGETVERVMERVREVGGGLGFRVVEGKGEGGGDVGVGLGKGRVALVFQGMEIAERLVVVEMGGVGVEFERECGWGELKDGLEDVLQWHNDAL